MQQQLKRINRVFRDPRLDRLFDFFPPLMALLMAMLIGSIMLVLLDVDPIEAYRAMADGAFGNQNATAETLVKAIPLMFVGIGITIAFRGGVINIGGEGQMIAGAVAGVWAAINFSHWPAEMLILVSLLAGFAAGAVWGGIAGFLKAYFDVNEILSTIMLNQIAVQSMNFLLNGPLLDPATAGFNNIPKTERIADHAELPRLDFTLPEPLFAVFESIGFLTSPDIFERTRLHYGLVIAIALALAAYIFLWRTSIGYRIRAVGENERAARYAGIKVKRQIMLSMLLAGGFAGLAGVVQVLGLQYRLQTDGSPAGFTANAGFNGIVAALFGGLNPLGVIPAATFFGGLLVGAQKLQREVQVSSSIIIAINGLIVIFVVSSQIFNRRRAKRRVSAAGYQAELRAKGASDNDGPEEERA